MHCQTCSALFLLSYALSAVAVNLDEGSHGSASCQVNPDTRYDISLLQLKQELSRTAEINETALAAVPFQCVMAAAVGSGVVAAAVIPEILAAVGFGAVGVTELSLAAAWQSTFGAGVVKRSLFSALQSLAMGGMGAENWIIVSGSLAALFTSFCAEVKSLSHGIIDTATQALHWLSNHTVEVGGHIRRVFPKLGNATADALHGVEGFVSETLDEATDSLADVIHTAVPKVQKAASRATQTAADRIGDALATIRSFFSGSSGQSSSFPSAQGSSFQISSFSLLPLCICCAVYPVF